MKALLIFFKALFKTALRFVIVIVLLPVVLIAVVLAGMWGYQFYLDYQAWQQDGPQWREKRIERQPYLAYENAADFRDIIEEVADTGIYHGIPVDIETDSLRTDIVVALEFMRNETPGYFRYVRNHTRMIREDSKKSFPYARNGITYMPVTPPPMFGIIRAEGTGSILVHEAVHHTQSGDTPVNDREREAFRKQVKFLHAVNAEPAITRKFESAAENWTEEKDNPWVLD